MRLLSLKDVVVAAAPDGTSRVAIQAGVALATGAGATLHIVHVTDDPAVTADTVVLSTLHGVDARVHIVPGDVADAIRSISDLLKADVIVLGPHRGGGHGGGSSPLGSTALGVVTNAAAPCLVISRELVLPLRRVLVPVDLSDTSRGALLVALSWASALRPTGEGEDAPPTLTALYVGTSHESVTVGADRVRALGQEVAELRDVGGSWAGVDVRYTTVVGVDTPASIARAAVESDAGLVVLGTRGLGLDPVGRIGSVAGESVRLVHVPLLLVPPAVWLTHAPELAAQRTSER